MRTSAKGDDGADVGVDVVDAIQGRSEKLDGRDFSRVQASRDLYRGQAQQLFRVCFHIVAGDERTGGSGEWGVGRAGPSWTSLDTSLSSGHWACMKVKVILIIPFGYGWNCSNTAK